MKPRLNVLCKNMVDLANKSNTYKELILYLTQNSEESLEFWRYKGIPVFFLQEISSFYDLLEKNQFTSEDCDDICHLINILQIIAFKQEVRSEIIRIQLPFFLYPFLNSSNASNKNELIRIASLNFINVFIRSNDTEIIHFFRKTEIIPLTLKCMDIGTVVTKVLSSKIFLFIIKNKEGLKYAVQTAERFVAISVMLNLVLGHCINIKSNDVIRNILECYVILSTEENARLSFSSNFPKNLVNEKIMGKIKEDSVLKDLFLKFHNNIKPESSFKFKK